jgi:hypothetical protein
MQKKGTRDERMNHVSIWNIPDQREQARQSFRLTLPPSGFGRKDKE